MATITGAIQLPNGVTLPYEERGDPSGVPVLLLHGLADSLRSFDLVRPNLPVFIRAIAVTQRGHGDADRPATGYRVVDFAGDLPAFMDALHVEAAYLAGASSGGLVAQRVAIDRPERVLGLVLIGSPATLHNKPGVRELWDSTISGLSDPIDPQFVRGFIESTVVKPVPQPFFETLVQESLKVPAHVWKAAVESFLQDDATADLHKITAPTLLLWGDRDELTREDQELLLSAVENSRRVVYPGAGHFLIAEEPERVAADLVAFVEGVATSGPCPRVAGMLH